MPQNRDINKQVAIASSFVPLLRTATVTGTGVDLAGYRSAMVLVHVGTVTDGTHTLSLEESDDDSTYTDVAAGDMSGSFTAAATATKVQEVGYLGTKRYIRVKSTVTGSPATGGTYGATIIRGDALDLPQ